MMAGSMVVAAKQVGANNIKQPAWWWLAHNKIREEAARLCTRRSGRSLKLSKEEPKDEGGEGFAKVKV